MQSRRPVQATYVNAIGAGRFDALAEEAHGGDEEEFGSEVVEVTVDSGAGKNVWPKSRRVAGKIEPLQRRVKLIAANGTDIEVLGEKSIGFETGGGRKCEIRYLITNVKEPLASVSAIVESGNRVVFDPAGSYIESKRTGERIELTRKDGTFVMKLDVSVGKVDRGDVGGVLDERGFQRQVQ